MKLNLGCGIKKEKNYINIDHNPKYNPDIIMDLNKNWKQFQDKSVSIIRAKAILEHLNSYEHFLQEAHRTLKDNGKLILIVPHYSWPDAYFPTHKHWFSASFFKKGFNYHSGPDYGFHVKSCKLVFSNNHLVNRIIGFLPNLNPVFYEKFIWKAVGINVVLTKKKENMKGEFF